MPVNAINHMPLQVLSTKAILVLLLYAAIVTVFTYMFSNEMFVCCLF